MAAEREREVREPDHRHANSFPSTVENLYIETRGLSYKKVRLFDPYFWSLERPKVYYLIVLTATTIVSIVIMCETFGRLKRTFF